MLFFFSSKTVFLDRKKKNSRILFVQETAVPLQMKLKAKWRLRKKKQTSNYNHLFWQKQAVEVADTLFTLWKQTSPGGKTI